MPRRRSSNVQFHVDGQLVDLVEGLDRGGGEMGPGAKTIMTMAVKTTKRTI